MAPNPQEEQVKDCFPETESNDRKQLQADGYLWQKVILDYFFFGLVPN